MLPSKAGRVSRDPGPLFHFRESPLMPLSDAVLDDISKAFEDSLQDVVTGAKSDIRKYVVTILHDAKQISTVAPERREKFLAELKGQSRALVELNRLRIVNEQWDMLGKGVEVLARILLAL